MGLDLLVEAGAKPGHEAEWRGLVERYFSKKPLTDGETERFAAISIPAHERLDAPRVGHDAAADAWIIEVRKATTPEEVAQVLKEFHGYYVLRLVQSDGLPEYSHGGLYEGVDETSFRGKFLDLCGDVLADDLLAEAWKHKMPEEAVRYGQALLSAAQSVEAHGPVARRAAPKRGLLVRLFRKAPEPDVATLEEQLRIVRAAGRWYSFWGERGHPICAWS